jgi:GNAT superfamily N-acetyltransferase
MDALDALHRERLPWMFRKPSGAARSEPFFADLLRREDGAVFVADAGPLVGVGIGVMRTAPELPVFVRQRWGVLESLVVDPAWRRRGIGKRLAQCVEDWAGGMGAPWVEVNVYDANVEAQHFYEALGYAPLSAKLRKVRSNAP